MSTIAPGSPGEQASGRRYSSSKTRVERLPDKEIITEQDRRMLQKIDLQHWPKDMPVEPLMSEQAEDWLVTLLVRKLKGEAEKMEAEASNIPLMDLNRGHLDLLTKAKGVRFAADYIAAGEWKK